MKIKLVNSSVSPAVTTVLVDGQERFVGEGAWGKSIGPNNLKINIAPGVTLNEFVGADRVQGEHVKCDHGVVSFGIERIFETPAQALSFIREQFIKEQSEGTLQFDEDIVFARAVVPSRTAAVVGCAVVINYTIEG